jgi:hypothetical protein
MLQNKETENHIEENVAIIAVAMWLQTTAKIINAIIIVVV